MLYLTYPDIQDYIAASGGLTHLDVLDCSQRGIYLYYLVATALTPAAMIVWSDVILSEEGPDPEDRPAFKEFTDELQKRIRERHAGVIGHFRKGKVKVRPGIYSHEPPPCLRLRSA